MNLNQYLFENVLRKTLEDCKTELLAKLWVVGKS